MRRSSGFTQNSQMTEMFTISKAEPCHPMNEAHFSYLYLGLNSGHDLRLVTIGEDWNIDKYLKNVTIKELNHQILLHQGSLEQHPQYR